MQTSLDGAQIEIRGANTASYMLTIDDIGFFISVSCEPVRNDWARGPIVLSEQIGPIIPGTNSISSSELCYEPAYSHKLWNLFITTCYSHSVGI